MRIWSVGMRMCRSAGRVGVYQRDSDGDGECDRVSDHFDSHVDGRRTWHGGGLRRVVLCGKR